MTGPFLHPGGDMFGYGQVSRDQWLETLQPLYPPNYTSIMTDGERYTFEIAARIDEAGDAFSNSDHQLLKADQAVLLNSGSDVQRQYIARAYYFNAWAIRSIATIKDGIDEMQTSQASVIADLDTFAPTQAAQTMYQLEIINEVHDYILASDMSRRLTEELRDTLIAVRNMAISGGATQMLNQIKTDIDNITTLRNTLFSGVATALMQGQTPTMPTFTNNDSTHTFWVEVEVLIFWVLRLICMIVNKDPYHRACRSWGYIRDRKRKMVNKRVWCSPTYPYNPS